jgi:hypothetical protein
LATYFGERPLELRLYDADEERLDLFDRFARAAFLVNDTGHAVTAGTDPVEALEGAQRIILQVGENCARKEARASGASVATLESELISASLERLLEGREVYADVLSLEPREVRIPLSSYYRLDWPMEQDWETRMATPHQVLRWVRGEEQLYRVFEEYLNSPFKRWLDDVSVATAVSEA